MQHLKLFLGAAMFVSSWTFTARAAESADPAVSRTIEFAKVGDRPLLLDLYRSDGAKDLLPVVVWVHGGAWRKGSRSSVPVKQLCEHGFAVASVDYRLSTEATFPAQVHDIKAAIRFLKANSAMLSLDAERFFVAGASAGGHLAALVGVSGGVAELEGNIGDHSSASSRVGGIVSFYGASNLETILAQSTPHGLSVRVPALQMLLGGQPDQVPALARLASPVAHVDQNDPPLLLIHGDQDPQMPINQSHELQGAYEAAGAEVKFRVIHGGKHGGAGFYDERQIDSVADFLASRGS